ncbi:DUF423 domain-containing protein [Bradyrhizobium sp. 83012]|uniref:DUF423 domain-containing protein n=1 Tax=Bradyrhizobium aeschynomenes TaxID=2734909 RepID=A0ABX2CGX5_9BRAD|nr:DUF423 domain-containing protein [Bradyrhizobium aeschynomenes]NPU66577.1 DUF423 domain-containing protein [Bradyrhizobium aeschynomenes]NPV20287.1 DUF423 domain-containing protein [Bradyrhizobium aeschynomenes]
MTKLWRLLIALAGLMGAAGVALAAKAAHDADASRLATASTMLLFHACALLGAVALAERGVVHRRIGLVAALGMVLGPALFAGDLLMRQFTGDRLFPFAAPVGGSLQIASWLVLALAALWPRRG